jgi:hypothetical protein
MANSRDVTGSEVTEMPLVLVALFHIIGWGKCRSLPDNVCRNVLNPDEFPA